MDLARMSMNHLRRVIPEEILYRAFIDPNLRQYEQTYSIDAIVIDEVIRGQVFQDCNMVGGTEVTIDLSSVRKVYQSNYMVTMYIPKSLTQGRLITRVLNLSFGAGHQDGFANATQMGSNAVMDAGRQLMNANMPIPIVSTAKIRLIGDNVVLVQDNSAIPSLSYLRCILENEEDFGNISPAYYPAFYKLVEYATKSMIYMRLVLKMERAFLAGGVDLGEFKSIVDGYADANELYNEELLLWTKRAFLNDPESKRRHLMMMIRCT